MKKRLEVRLEKEFNDMLEVLAFEQGMTKSDLIRSMIFDKHQELATRIGFKGISELCKMMKEGC